MDREKNSPIVSIVLPVYNTARYLDECIQSLLAQTYADFELIVVDDASTDNSVAIIESYRNKDARVRLVRHDLNQGRGVARNSGITVARGKYIANFDSDDIAFPEWIETQVGFLESNPSVDIVGANFTFINELGEILFEKNQFPESDRDIKKILPLVCPIANNTVLIRRKCFDEFGTYHVGARYAEDYDLWMRFRDRFTFHNVQQSLVYYRIHGQNSIVLEGKNIARETLSDLLNKLRSVFPPSLVVTRFVIASIISYLRVFFMLRYQNKRSEVAVRLRAMLSR